MSICDIGHNISVRKFQTSQFNGLKVIFCCNMCISIYYYELVKLVHECRRQLSQCIPLVVCRNSDLPVLYSSLERNPIFVKVVGMVSHSVEFLH